VTHDHADHLSAGPLVAALRSGRLSAVYGPPTVVEALVDADAPTGRVHKVRSGDRLRIGSLDVAVLGELHSQIHPDIPRILNVGYLVDGVFHPGDALTEPNAPTEILLTPVGGPWLRLADAIDLVREVSPRVAIPIHDAVLSEAGRQSVDRLVSRLGGAGEYRRLGVGETYLFG
jgi:L-ascorbate metabolism protein UlaG (beta-lactamase superfamily)